MLRCSQHPAVKCAKRDDHKRREKNVIRVYQAAAEKKAAENLHEYNSESDTQWNQFQSIYTYK